MPDIIQNVPTNIISGFLGVGKTTAILSLFSNKPANEKWAVLVNEFGKVGIDGKIYKTSGIKVKEIPGGCVCCAQGLPLLMAVNQILRETKPDRLIIESSGLGHSGGVLKTLTGDNFNKVLTIKAGICLLDPGHLKQHAYSQNDLFKEQLQFADVLVANKIDLADKEAIELFYSLENSFVEKKELLTTTQNGVLNIEWLDYPHTSRFHQSKFSLSDKQQSKPQSIKFETHSFCYPGNTVFDLDLLKIWLNNLQLIRLKGFVQTKSGCFLLNCSRGQVNVAREENNDDNYIEVIDETLNIPELEQSIKQCML